MKAIVGIAMLAMATVVGVARAADPPAGATSCSGCHTGVASVSTAVGRLQGRSAADIATQMQAFRSGQRPATVMDRIAKGFTDPEVAAIAAWYAGQK